MKRDAEEDLFVHLMEESAKQTLYVYRVGPDGRLIKPYLMCTSPWSDLLHTLRDGHGGGDFRIMIREGRKMIYRGDIAVVRGVNLGTSRRLPRLGAHY